MATTRRKSKVKTEETAMTLEQVQEATSRGEFVYTSPEFHNPLVESGEVEINPAMTDENGNIATRAIIKAEEPATEQKQMTETQTKTLTFSGIVSGVELPPVNRARPIGAGRKEIYPFSTMEVGQSFFVPVIEGKAHPMKALSSTVSSATRRFAEETGEKRLNRKGEEVPVLRATRKFEIRAVGDGAPWGFTGQPGAMIARTA